MTEGVCQVSLCAREGEFEWGGIPICWEHRGVMVDIQDARERRDHSAGTCACSVHEPVEACRIGAELVRDRQNR